mmetsp:Transcript_22464/g.30738  ORF Transcript_22464/g.30738 Transcript_22464/m.30738 type:complete len:90 (-) Transcript_22464:484-753(-)
MKRMKKYRFMEESTCIHTHQLDLHGIPLFSTTQDAYEPAYLLQELWHVQIGGHGAGKNFVSPMIDKAAQGRGAEFRETDQSNNRLPLNV